jgi:hypothetical protein
MWAELDSLQHVRHVLDKLDCLLLVVLEHLEFQSNELSCHDSRPELSVLSLNSVNRGKNGH